MPPGGNRVRSYLDVLCPDDTAPAEVETALTGLRLELVADEAAPGGRQGPLPNPVVYHGKALCCGSGSKGHCWPTARLEMAELRRLVDAWDEIPRAGHPG